MLFADICPAIFLFIIFLTFGQRRKPRNAQRLFIELQFVHNEQAFYEVIR